MATFKFYYDVDLSTPVTGNVQIGEGSTTTVFYLGSTDESKKLQDATNPGVSNIEVSVVDATPGSGPEDTWVKLALTSGGLSGAVPGDPLSLGNTILGGVASAVAVYVGITNTLSGASSSTDLSLQVSGVKEFAV
jgi:hypothetical protein